MRDKNKRDRGKNGTDKGKRFEEDKAENDDGSCEGKSIKVEIKEVFGSRCGNKFVTAHNSSDKTTATAAAAGVVSSSPVA